MKKWYVLCMGSAHGFWHSIDAGLIPFFSVDIAVQVAQRADYERRRREGVNNHIRYIVCREDELPLFGLTKEM